MAETMERVSGKQREREEFPSTGLAREVAPDLAYLRCKIVNVMFSGPSGAGDRGWVLIDTGLYGSAGKIAQAAEERFGAGARPRAIILTHGHFDHIGAVRELAESWDAVVYAHPLELPYLTGASKYPPPDPTVGGGAMARLSFTYPRGPIDLGSRVQPLPADGSVPGMPGWRWIHTPGHTAGHVSLFRDADRTLVAGDAFVTTRQEALTYVLEQTPEVNGPPMYYTPDWAASELSVQALAMLEPEIAVTGHGIPLSGPQLREELKTLALEFRDVAVPAHGRYVNNPAVTDERGIVSVPPPVVDRDKVYLAAGMAFGVGLLAAKVASVRRHRRAEAHPAPRAAYAAPRHADADAVAYVEVDDTDGFNLSRFDYYPSTETHRRRSLGGRREPLIL
ncbi:glyoxylase-like metal-dependent hydrolase (beta-lactamase superfamily II) [Longimicrobium terrae]|uniref:Glyoxylase-like metal-dependent hydrolase (Beta-lactamase superfamily II) n=1 Tax=Longimicrobium terrae TaxID=1639882 RepID=A0A841H404_9BACT|nr:MBL fold metallo-hydrolase [Longimicrobium terrae]MBB4638402.1 glyoxylase-like metal-dependent hydrolase (beta-lactamase superfamily II) [Longimicrobium terrae]MBB6072529.1 glyoxylase-like metal-dependent hydrolase (beta-lactamase superfamily II) [Longimicrobium terrae]NNC28690.1 MBL fold metallo-hydrolase [Longimicrobium terrae]